MNFSRAVKLQAMVANTTKPQPLTRAPALAAVIIAATIVAVVSSSRPFSRALAVRRQRCPIVHNAGTKVLNPSLFRETENQ
ncbi:MAG: hypothetical protein HZC06_06345 [Methylocystis sp.]|nr:hypothetical protein [Methylocystis sp.]